MGPHSRCRECNLDERCVAYLLSSTAFPSLPFFWLIPLRDLILVASPAFDGLEFRKAEDSQGDPSWHLVNSQGIDIIDKLGLWVEYGDYRRSGGCKPIEVITR